MEQKCRSCKFYKWAMIPVLDYEERTSITRKNHPEWDTLTVGKYVIDNRKWELKKSDHGDCGYYNLGPIYDHFCCDSFSPIVFTSHEIKRKGIHLGEWKCSRRNFECYCLINQMDCEGCYSANKIED